MIIIDYKFATDLVRFMNFRTKSKARLQIQRRTRTIIASWELVLV